jgi:hypothetical protein
VGAGAGTTVSKGIEHNQQSKTAADQTGGPTPMNHTEDRGIAQAPTAVQ